MLIAAPPGGPATDDLSSSRQLLPDSNSSDLTSRLMSTPAPCSGKTAPYVITQCVRQEASYSAAVSSAISCHHDFTIIGSSSTLPPPDHRPTHSEEWKLEGVCKRCRHGICLTNRQPGHSTRPCPNADYPLHHFVPQHSPSTGSLDASYQCSAPECAACLDIQYQPCLVQDHHLRLLTDSNALNSRYNEAFQQEADRNGFRLATPVDALHRLRRYISDAIASQGPDKKIPSKNKRFLEAFGTDCDDLFEHLGFRFVAEGDVPVWYLPRCRDGSKVYGAKTSDQWRNYLSRWEVELYILIESFASTLQIPSPYSHVLHSAMPEMLRLVSAQGYPRQVWSRTISVSPADVVAYASLGALSDFSDELIMFCYDRQSLCDPQARSSYFDSLNHLAKSRESEALMLKATMLESQGLIGQRDIDEAYQFLDIDKTADDAYIVSKFRSRYDDTGPSMRPHMKHMLQRLAQARGSSVLQDAASDTLETYEQAIAWLGAHPDQADDVMVVLHTTKVADNSDNATLATKAIQIIADHRKSEGLASWLKTGELKETSLDIDTACRHLKIQLDAVDPAMLQVVFDNARSDNPGQKTEQAIAAVLAAYKEPVAAPGHPPNSWPVGLTSHGNTCYLNSLLQYYFTITPLRNLVLDFDQHAFDLGTHHGKHERVGARKVKAFEIRAHQKFVKSLRELFRAMITDVGPTVKPDADLVCRAFLAPEDTETAAPSAAISESGHADTTMTVEEQQQPDTDPQMSQTSSATPIAAQNDASETTAVSPDGQVSLQPPLQGPALPERRMTTPELQQSNLQKAEEAAKQQQDVTEVMDEIMFRLRCAIKPAGLDSTEEQLDPFRDIFFMRIATATFANGLQRSPQIEFAMNILLNIPAEPTDLYTALDEVFDLQTIDHGGKKVRQYKTLQSTPPILQINIPRITYDRATFRGVKVEHKVHLHDELYLDRYVDAPETDLLDRRMKCWSWRKELQSLEAQRDLLRRSSFGIDGPDVMEAASQHILAVQSLNDDLTTLGHTPFDIDQSISSHLSQDAQLMRHRLNAIETSISSLKAKIADIFNDLKQIKYTLHSVFFHRGSYGHGHYWTYIRDFQNDSWRIYNDEKVDGFTQLNDIYDAETWQQGTPTYAVYVKEELKHQYVQSVCRDIPEPQKGEPSTPTEDNGLLIDLDEHVNDAPTVNGNGDAPSGIA